MILNREQDEALLGLLQQRLLRVVGDAEVADKLASGDGRDVLLDVAVVHLNLGIDAPFAAVHRFRSDRLAAVGLLSLSLHLGQQRGLFRVLLVKVERGESGGCDLGRSFEGGHGED